MGWTGDSATWALSTNILKVWKKNQTTFGLNAIGVVLL
jgi:hypothetical protein